MTTANHPVTDAARRALTWAVLVATVAVGTMVLVPDGARAAQNLGLSAGSNNPIQVYADSGIEWNQNKHQYIARGNAKAIQGTTTVYGDTLIAYYEEVGGGTTEVYRLDAVGHVRIVSPDQTAYGDKAVYDVRKGVLVMTGKNLKLVTATEIITARDSLEYYEQKDLAVARGNAVSRPVPQKTPQKKTGTTGTSTTGQGDRTVRADILTAHFRNDQQSKGAKSGKSKGKGGNGTGDHQSIERMEAFGHVVVTRPGEISMGNRGAYFPDRDVAHLWGNVRITRGDNQLNGQFAEVNFKTGISRILSGAKAPVQALIEPGKKPENPRPGN